MARSLNKVLLIGNIADEPVKRTVGDNGNSVVNVTLVTNEYRTGEDGSYSEFPSWHRISLWGNLANVAENYIHKGSKVYVEGKLRYSSYVDKNTGVKRYSTEIFADQLILLDKRSDNAPFPNYGSSGVPASAPAYPNNYNNEVYSSDNNQQNQDSPYGSSSSDYSIRNQGGNNAPGGYNPFNLPNSQNSSSMSNSPYSNNNNNNLYPTGTNSSSNSQSVASPRGYYGQNSVYGQSQSSGSTGIYSQGANVQIKADPNQPSIYSKPQAPSQLFGQNQSSSFPQSNSNPNGSTIQDDEIPF